MQTVLTAPSRNNLTYLLTLRDILALPFGRDFFGAQCFFTMTTLCWDSSVLSAGVWLLDISAPCHSLSAVTTVVLVNNCILFHL